MRKILRGVKMNKSKQLTEGALLTAVYIVLLLIVFFIPVLQLVGIFVLPVPFAIYAAHHGWKPSIVMAFVALLLTAMFATIVSLPMTLLSAIGGIVIGNGMHRKKNAYDTWARGTVAYVVGFVLILAMLQFVFSINIFDEINLVIDEMMATLNSITSQLQFGTDVESQLEIIEEQMRQFPDLLPSTMVIMSIIYALITQWVSYKVINRLNRENYSFPPFKQLNFPPAIIWLYLLALIVSFVGGADQGSTLGIVIVNAMALLSILLIIQGFSFIFFIADYKKIHKAVPIGAVVVTLLIPFIFMFLIEITGIIDLGISLKKRISESKS